MLCHVLSCHVIMSCHVTQETEQLHALQHREAGEGLQQQQGGAPQRQGPGGGLGVLGPSYDTSIFDINRLSSLLFIYNIKEDVCLTHIPF